MRRRNGKDVVNLFIIGVRKAGTSWLYYLLDQHPDIFMSQVKELYFFGAHYPEQLDTYHRHFPFEAPYRYFGEATVTYFQRADIAREIKAYSPEAKVLAIVRDPIERLLSQFRYHKQIDVLPEAATLRDVFDEAEYMLADSHYEQTLPAYREVFGDQFRVISLEEATSDLDRFWADMQAFLDVDAVPLPDPKARPRNPTGSAAFRWIYRNTIPPIKRKYPDVYERMQESALVRWAKRSLLRVLGTAQRDSLSDEERALLLREFAPTYTYLHQLGFTAYRDPTTW